MFLHILTANYLNHYKIAIEFNNGSHGVADLSDSLTGKIFEPLQDINFFKQFKVDEELGTICWENGADFAPEYLYFLAFKNVPELQEQFQQWGYLTNKIPVSV
jgi:hypothetical protein